MRLFTGLLEYLHDKASGFPQSKRFEKMVEKLMSQNHLALEATISFWLYRLVLFSVGKITEGHEYKKVRLIWATFRMATTFHVL